MLKKFMPITPRLYYSLGTAGVHDTKSYIICKHLNTIMHAEKCLKPCINRIISHLYLFLIYCDLLMPIQHLWTIASLPHKQRSRSNPSPTSILQQFLLYLSLKAPTFRKPSEIQGRFLTFPRNMKKVPMDSLRKVAYYNRSV